MSYTKIAHAAPFEGAPAIHLPAVYGASPDMPMLLRVPVTGERPVTVTAELPAGLSIDEKRIISGSLPAGEYTLTVTADADWINSDETAFPVVIDPIITTKLTKTDVNSTFISEDPEYSDTALAYGYSL